MAETRHFIMLDDPQWFYQQVDAFLAKPVGIRSDAGEKVIADLAGGGGLGFLAVRHYTQQRDFAKFW